MELEHLVDSTMESGKQPLFLILDQISDARNFGAIIRTAECTGVNGIIIQKAGSAPVNGDTVKTSAGAVTTSSPKKFLPRCQRQRKVKRVFAKAAFPQSSSAWSGGLQVIYF